MESATALQIASQIGAAIDELQQPSTSALRTLRRDFSRDLRTATPALVLQVAADLIVAGKPRWFACELVRHHAPAFNRVTPADVEALGSGIDNWGEVDGFARILAGPAWLGGRVPDEMIQTWAMSNDRWWRRAALVSTVALNSRTDGGAGDAPRTLGICTALVADRDDMVQKALSWALRQLATFDAPAVEGFLAEHDARLSALVKREVTNKLRTGLKNPSRA
jgi:3-methyladenine DNA glycosylase AlkD